MIRNRASLRFACCRHDPMPPYVYVRLIIPFSYLYKDSHIERKIQHIVLPADIIAAQYD